MKKFVQYYNQIETALFKKVTNLNLNEFELLLSL
jgi:hypothetical protein